MSGLCLVAMLGGLVMRPVKFVNPVQTGIFQFKHVNFVLTGKFRFKQVNSFKKDKFGFKPVDSGSNR